MEDFLLQDSLAEAIEYLISCYPSEGCGVIGVKAGEYKWFPCANVSQDPSSEFILHATDYMCAELESDFIYAVVHSHPDASADASPWDIKACNAVGIPFIIVSTPDVQVKKFLPQNTTYTDYEGRDYQFGLHDCWTLVCDYYAQEYGIHLTRRLFVDDWWEKGLDYFSDFKNYGFEEVDSLKVGDLITFKVMSPVDSHCGVYLGEDRFLHHPRDRLSTIDSLHSFWGRYKSRVLRYAKG